MRYGPLHFEDSAATHKRGPIPRVCILNEQQFTRLLMEMRTTGDRDAVTNAKDAFNDEFYRMRQQLMEKKLMQANEVWKVGRGAVKITTNGRMAAVQKYVDYAISQGSKTYRKRPELAFINISKLAMRHLFNVAPYLKTTAKKRDHLNPSQLADLDTVERVIETAIGRGIEEGLHYKDIYRTLDSRVATAIELMGLEKTPVPAYAAQGLPNAAEPTETESA